MDEKELLRGDGAAALADEYARQIERLIGCVQDLERGSPKCDVDLEPVPRLLHTAKTALVRWAVRQLAAYEKAGS